MKQFTVEQFEYELRTLAKKINSVEVNNKLARKCREIVYRRVKDGYGVNADTRPAQNTQRVKLKPLSPSYVAYREGKVKFFRAKDGHVYPVSNEEIAASVVQGKSSRGSKRSGNAAHTKIKFKKTAFHNKFDAPTLGPWGRPKKSNATFSGEMMEEIYMGVTHEGFSIYIRNSKRKDDSGLTNKKVSELYSADRPFFALTAGEVRILQREMEKIIQDLISKQF
jgi:hypothetical protein